MAASMKNVISVLKRCQSTINPIFPSQRLAEVAQNTTSNIRKREIFTSTPEHSLYNPLYIEPITNKDEMPLDVKELGDRVFYPVKALSISHKFCYYHDPVVERFINCCMSHGDKRVAREIVAKSFEKVKLLQLAKYHKAESEEDRQRIICDPVKIFHLAMENVTPVLMLMRHIKSGTIYMVPVAAKPHQAELIAFKWLRDTCKDKPKFVKFWDALGRELVDASQNTGKCVKKKLDLHRKCDQNKAYAHFVRQ